jgi:hypothetical protein
LDSANFIHFLHGFPFLLRHGGFLPKRYSVVDIKDFSLQSKDFPNKTYPTKLYIRKNRPNDPVIFFVHGMSINGIKDSRMMEMAINLARSGFRVITPEFEEICNLQIKEESIHNITDSFLSAFELPELKGRPFGFFSVSFTGGMGMISLTDKRLSNKVQSAMVVGPYAHFDNLIRYVTGPDEIDEYGYLIFLANFLDLVFKNTENIQKVLWEAAVDNSLLRTGEASVADKMVKDLSPEEKDLYIKIRTDRSARAEFGETIIKNYGHKTPDFSPISFLDKFNLPISVLHGRKDKVVPESESLVITEKLKSLGKPYFLEITGLLSHGDKVPIYKSLHEIYGLGKSFGYFFVNLR